MPRTMDPRLAQAQDRANPQTCYVVDVHVPDVGLTLRRAIDQFLASPPLVSQSPASSIAADPAGALTIASIAATLASFTHQDDTTSFGLQTVAIGNAGNEFRSLRWQVDPSFGRAVLRTFTAIMKRASTNITNDLALQIYRVQGAMSADERAQFEVLGIVGGSFTFVPLLANPVIWKNTPAKWGLGGFSTTVTPVEFDLSDLHLQVGTSNTPPLDTALVGEEDAYYFSIEPVNGSKNDQFHWILDATTSRTVAGVGLFEDRRWGHVVGATVDKWELEAAFDANVPTATLEIDHYLASAQAIYALSLPQAPQSTSQGVVVFDRSAPTGTTATLELSTAGSGGPWTAVTDGTPVTTLQQNYHLRATITSTTARNIAAAVAAMGIQFSQIVDVSAEAIVDPIAQEIDVPFCAASIGEGSVQIVRTGRRDYRDPGSDIVTPGSVSKLEVQTRLGSRHPQVPRDAWMLIDRASVNNRTPTPTAEQFGLLSFLKNTKRMIPPLIESINQVFTVTAATTTDVTVTPALPVVDGTYAGRGFYMRVRSSTQPGIGTGYLQTIDNNSGTNDLLFTAPLPGTLAVNDTIELHSALFLQEGLTWADADPADVWLDILTNQLAIPIERIGRSDLGRGGKSGFPPSVVDRAPGDTATQAKLAVTLQITQQESADELINQLSFIMGGATVDVGGQIVFRQIYPLRDVNGQIVVAAEPVAATFDARNTAGLNTPASLEQRIAQLSCNYGVDTTIVGGTTPPALTTNFVDVDALASLDDQAVDDLAAASIDDKIARWCYNSADLGLYLASMLTQQVVRAASTGLRVWTWGANEQRPDLVVGDRVAVITDQYTDYDPGRQIPIRGLVAYALVLVSVTGGGRQFRGFMLGLNDATQLRGGPGDLAASTITPDDIADGFLEFTWEDSSDNLTRTVTWVRGPLVDRVLVYEQTLRAPVTVDPFDFLAVGPVATLAVGTDSFTIPKPAPNSADTVFARFEAHRADGTVGQVRPMIIAPGPRVVIDVVTSTAEAAGVGTVTAVVADPGALLNPAAVDGAATGAISWRLTTLGVGTVESSSTVPASGTSGTYTKNITLDPLHNIQVTAIAHFLDGSTQTLGSWTFDSNKISDVVTAGASYVGSTGVATATVNFDTDTQIGASGAQYRIDGGSWTALTVSSALIAQWTIAQTSSTQTIDVQGKDAIDGTFNGHIATFQVDAYSADGPSMSAVCTLTDTTFSIAWSGAGVITVSIDGGTPGTPSASPITGSRDTHDHTYSFLATRAGQSTPANVTVPNARPTTGTLGLFTAFSHSLQDATLNTIRILATFTGTATGYVLLTNDIGFTGDSTGNTWAVAGSPSSFPYDYTAGEDLVTGISGTGGTRSIGFQLQAIDSMTLVGTSTQVFESYGWDL